MQEPRVFFSYSHDSEEHKAWVLTLATRLERNGVAVILDQWDLNLGNDLPLFMELGLTTADRVIVVCTEQYVKKANAMHSGGVAYEKMIISSQIMADLGSNRVIPIVVGNSDGVKVPTFIGGKYRLNFDPAHYESSYTELIADLWGEKVRPRPARGENPFLRMPEPHAVDQPIDDREFISPSLQGKIVFDPSQNDGSYTVGEGEMSFKLLFSVAGRDQVWVYKRPDQNIVSLKIAIGYDEIDDVDDANQKGFYEVDNSECLRLGDVAILQNQSGYYLGIVLRRALHRARLMDDRNEVTIDYKIAPGKSTSFSRHV